MSEYVGSELELFAQAVRWKAYWSSRVLPYAKGDVLDVGAGIGSTLSVLANPDIASWCALEPDPALAASIDTRQAFPVDVRVGTTMDLQQSFDAVLYIDVLEHIENDQAELSQAGTLLNPGGHLVVLAPAHNQLMSPFDHAIGHHRRYNRAMLRHITPPGLRIVRNEYLDSVGMLASLANRLLLRQQLPTIGQIRTWDRFMVPCSRIMDALTLRRLGKTILCVWHKDT